jgi:hypothetical protein
MGLKKEKENNDCRKVLKCARNTNKKRKST